MEKPNRFHTLDADVWKEVEPKPINTSGYTYVGRKYHEKYEARVFVKLK